VGQVSAGNLGQLSGEINTGAPVALEVFPPISALLPAAPPSPIACRATDTAVLTVQRVTIQPVSAVTLDGSICLENRAPHTPYPPRFAPVLSTKRL
jgi:hypothetical protein